MNSFYLDVESYDVRNVMRALSALKTTRRIDNDGAYRDCLEYTRIYLETSLTLEEIENRYQYNGKLQVYGVCNAPFRNDGE